MKGNGERNTKGMFTPGENGGMKILKGMFTSVSEGDSGRGDGSP